jgi:hypothetical protein
MMIDCPDHLCMLRHQWRTLWEECDYTADMIPLQVCIDVDMSYRPFNTMHLGAHRSPVRTAEHLSALCSEIASSRDTLCLAGLMGYEAQVAGVPDAVPQAGMYNVGIRCMKWLSMRDIVHKRASMDRAISNCGMKLKFFNGGGTGNFAAACADPTLSEVTMGSGLLQGHLFDYFAGNMAQPAMAIALQATRACEQGVLTCQSGGFIASGAVSPDKTPMVVSPRGLRPFPAEGFGEVQSPLHGPQGIISTVQIGDPVVVRPAKSGEIAEHFNYYLLIATPPVLESVMLPDNTMVAADLLEEGFTPVRVEENGRVTHVVGRAATYRGIGLAFY